MSNGAAPPSTFVFCFSSFRPPTPSAPFLSTFTTITPSSTPATSTTNQASLPMPSFVVIPATSPAPSPAATTAPMAAPVTAATPTSTSLVAASTRGTTSNVSTTVFTTPKLPSETKAVVGPSSSLTYTSKNSSNFSSSSVGSSLCPSFRADGLVNTVLVNYVPASRLKGHFQTCNDSRVVPPLGTPTDAMEKLSPKEDVLQIAHPIHPPKEPDKACRCQVPIFYSPLQKAWLHLAFIPHYMTFAMIVFNSYGSRRNILAHDVFDKTQKREIAQNYVPHLLFLIRNVPRAIELILVFQTTFLTGTFGWVSLCFVDSFDLHELHNQYINSKFGKPIEYSAYLDTISQPQKIPRKLKSLRQYREYMENLLAYLIYFFQRTEPLQDLDRIFLKVETDFDEQWAPGTVKGWENEKQTNGQVQDQLTMLDLDYSSTVEELMAVGPDKLNEALASFGLQTRGTVQHAVETTLGSPITLLTGTFAGVSLCSMDTFFRMIGNAPKWEFPGRGSMICSTIWNNILTLMANGIFSTFMSGLTKVISTFTLSRHMIDTMTSVCLVLSDCSTCAINFILGNTLSVFPTPYFLEYLFTNTIGSQLLHERKMKHIEISNDSLVLLSRWFWTSIIIASWSIQGSVLSSNFFVVVLSQDHVIERAVPDSMVAVKTTARHPMVAGTLTRADNAYAGIDATSDQIQLLMVIFYYLLHCIIHHDPKLEPFRHSRDEKTLEAIEFGLYYCFVQPTKQLITVGRRHMLSGPSDYTEITWHKGIYVLCWGTHMARGLQRLSTKLLQAHSYSNGHLFEC